MASAGEMKEVSNGFYRNFLLPKKLAQPATGRVIANAKAHETARQRRHQQEGSQMQTLARAVDGLEILVHAKASAEGKLFGSVTPAVIVAAAARAGHALDAHWVKLERPIKTLGKQSVEIQFPHGQKAAVMVEVVRE